ncbi:MAG: hypothetical protein HY962_04310 [Ignavibacteriae bacterium]|nr:hypothetical protein [Ignavibacteriota bacterium]
MEHQDFDQYQRLVDAALDGELDAARESQLYEQLAADAALRDTLRGAQAIRSATRAYSSAMTPPADLGAALFARLGIDTAATVTTKKGHKNPILGRMGLLPAIGLVLLLSGGVFLYFFSSSNSSNPAAPSVSTHTVPAVPAPARTVPAAPAPASTRMDHEGSLAERAPAESAGRVQSADTRTFSAQHTAPASAPAPREKSQASDNTSATVRDARAQETSGAVGTGIHSTSVTHAATRSGTGGDSGSGALGTHDNAAPLVPPDKAAAAQAKMEETLPASASTTPALTAQDIPAHQSLVPIGTSPVIQGRGTDFIRDLRASYPLRSGLATHRLLLRLRGYGLSPSPSTDIGPRSSPFVNNMAASLMYNLGSEHALGLEGGQEAYPQEYEGTENGRTVRYQQNLLTPWIGVAYRYRPLWARSEAGVSGSIATHAGITREYWPQLRLAVGLQYAVIPPLSLELGIEGLLVAYPFQDRWFTTRKIGVTYGLLVAF